MKNNMKLIDKDSNIKTSDQAKADATMQYLKELNHKVALRMGKVMHRQNSYD